MLATASKGPSAGSAVIADTNLDLVLQAGSRRPADERARLVGPDSVTPTTRAPWHLAAWIDRTPSRSRCRARADRARARAFGRRARVWPFGRTRASAHPARTSRSYRSSTGRGTARRTRSRRRSDGAQHPCVAFAAVTTAPWAAASPAGGRGGGGTRARGGRDGERRRGWREHVLLGVESERRARERACGCGVRALRSRTDSREVRRVRSRAGPSAQRVSDGRPARARGERSNPTRRRTKPFAVPAFDRERAHRQRPLELAKERSAAG